MSNVQITWLPIPDWQWGGTTAKLRLYSSRDWIDSAGVLHLHGTVGSKTGFYQEIDCDVSGTVLTPPTFTTYSTSDALDPIEDRSSILITGVLFDYKDARRETLFENFQIQTTTPVTFAALKIRNRAKTLPQAVPTYLDATGVQTLIDIAIGTLNDASVTVKGRTKLSVAPVLATNPIAVGDNDPRMSLQPGGSIVGYRILASNYAFSTTSSTAVTVTGVKDPIDRELSFTVGAAGSIPATDGVIICFTYTNAAGETLHSQIRLIAVVASGSIVIPSPPAATGATGWNLYAVQGAGGTNLANLKRQNGSPIAIGTPITLTAISTGGASLPSANTTGGSQTVTVADSTYIYAPVDPDNYGTPVYHAILIGAGTANEEYVYVTARTATSFTASFSKTHTAGFTVSSATGGINEAIMSLPGYPGRGGTVVIPQVTTIKSPIWLRTAVNLYGDSGPVGFGDLGGFVYGSTIIFASTDPGLGAVMSGYVSASSIDIKNVHIWSNTNAIYSLGRMGGNGMTITGCVIYGNTSHVVHDTAGIRASHGGSYLRVRDSIVVGSPAIWLYGAFQNDVVFEHLQVIPVIDTNDLAYKAEGIVIGSNAGGITGPAGGGFLRIKDITTESGNGALLNLTDVNFDIEQFDVADWAPSNIVPQVVIKNTASWAIGTQKFNRCTFTQIASPTVPVVQLVIDHTLEAFNTIGLLEFNECGFANASPAVDAASARGPIVFTGCKGVNPLLTTGVTGILNPPFYGVIGYRNMAAAGNNPDPVWVSTVVGIEFTKARGLSSTITPSNNLCGTVTLSGGTAAVTFPNDPISATPKLEADTSYRVMLGGNANETFRWSSKTTAGFTITSSNAASTAIVDWIISR